MRAPLLRGRDLAGHPVVSVRNGEAVAEVRDVVFDPQSGLLTGFTLNKRGAWSGRMRAVLPMERVHAVGTGAVMVADADALAMDGGEVHQISDASDADAEVTDDLVVTESGQTLGTVRDVVVEGGPSPHVVGYEIVSGDGRTQFIPRSPHSGVSGTALVVPDDYADRTGDELSVLSDHLGQLREPS